MNTHHYAWGVDYTDEQLARELIGMSNAVEIAMSNGGAWIVKRAGERMLELLSGNDPRAVETSAEQVLGCQHHFISVSAGWHCTLCEITVEQLPSLLKSWVPPGTWPRGITLPVNRGYIVTDETPTKCIHGVQLMPPGRGVPCEPCFKLVTGSAVKATARFQFTDASLEPLCQCDPGPAVGEVCNACGHIKGFPQNGSGERT